LQNLNLNTEYKTWLPTSQTSQARGKKLAGQQERVVASFDASPIIRVQLLNAPVGSTENNSEHYFTLYSTQTESE